MHRYSDDEESICTDTITTTNQYVQQVAQGIDMYGHSDDTESVCTDTVTIGNRYVPIQ